MRNKIMLGIMILCIIALFAGAYAVYNNFKDSVSSDDILKPTVTNSPKPTKAKEITVTDQNGQSVALSDFLGKPVVLNFWASWCPPCREEMPYFSKLSQEYSDVVFLMVDLTDGSRETKDKALEYVKDNGYSFDIYFDLDGSAGNTYAVQSIPTSVFVDKEGNISSKKIGSITESDLKSRIEKIK